MAAATYHGTVFLHYDSRACQSVTKIHELIVNGILANPKLIPNTEDMFNYQEDSYQEIYEEEETENELIIIPCKELYNKLKKDESYWNKFK